MSEIMLSIKSPLSSSVLDSMICKLTLCLKHNFIPGLLVVAGAAMSFHYQLIVALCSGCSVVVASGPNSTGKITAIKVGLSLFGCCNNNIFVREPTEVSSRGHKCPLSHMVLMTQRPGFKI